MNIVILYLNMYSLNTINYVSMKDLIAAFLCGHLAHTNRITEGDVTGPQAYALQPIYWQLSCVFMLLSLYIYIYIY